MLLLAIGFFWAHKVGEWRATLKPIIFKKHPNNFRLQNNFFRYGFDLIHNLIINPSTRHGEHKVRSQGARDRHALTGEAGNTSRRNKVIVGDTRA